MNRSDIPEHLVDAVHAAARATPAHSGDVAAARRRGSAYRRHRATATTGLAAAAVATALVAPTALGAGDQPVPGPSATTETPTTTPTHWPEPAQRLLLDPRSFMAAYWPDDYRSLRVAGEVSPDGEVVDWDLPEVHRGWWYNEEFLPVGSDRLAVLATEALKDDTSDDARGYCLPGEAVTLLLVLAADGTVELSRELSDACDPVRMIHVDAEALYLLRGTVLTAHHLVTGEERSLSDVAEQFGALPVPAALDGFVTPWPVAFDGRLLATVGEQDLDHDGPAAEWRRRCRQHSVEMVDVVTGERTSWPVPDWCARSVRSLHLSPDGSYAALAVEHPGEAQRGIRVAVVDLADGSWVAQADRPGQLLGALPGIAWRDDTTLQVAWPGPDSWRGGEIIEVETVRVR